MKCLCAELLRPTRLLKTAWKGKLHKRVPGWQFCAAACQLWSHLAYPGIAWRVAGVCTVYSPLTPLSRQAQMLQMHLAVPALDWTYGMARTELIAHCGLGNAGGDQAHSGGVHGEGSAQGGSHNRPLQCCIARRTLLLLQSRGCRRRSGAYRGGPREGTPERGSGGAWGIRSFLGGARRMCHEHLLRC